ncbi:MAG: DUF1223 domain-containing protein [Ferruginibacter sp.]
MNNYKLKICSFAFVCAILIITTSSQCKTQPKTIVQPMNADGFVVMELFTSQGCSSCPPADKLLGKYASQNDDRMITLAFHVDYWNRLGWTDSFSSPKFSSRQRDYANSIENASVYTPQLIINGTKEFVGSDASKIGDEVALALKNKPGVLISTGTTQKNGNSISIDYELDKITEHTTLQAALIQKQVFTGILKGENRGLKLNNYSVVRDFVSTAINSKKSKVELQFPVGYNEKDFAIVLYAQDNASGKIIGATKKNL